MKITALRSVFLAVPDVETVAGCYQRLGLRLSPARDGVRSFAVGGPANLFSVRLTPPVHQQSGLFALHLDADNLDEVRSALRRQGIPTRETSPAEVVQGLWVGRRDGLCSDLLFSQAGPSGRDHAEHERAGLLKHDLPLLRLDHLASVAADLEAGSAFWQQTLGVPTFGEVRTPAMVIRQLKIGDAMFELLGAADASSPVWQRPQGLVSMASWEVADLDAVVAGVRKAGFSVSDPAVGVLPGTRIATVPGGELGGMNLQLLQYV